MCSCLISAPPRAAVCESCWGSVDQGEGLPCQACRWGTRALPPSLPPPPPRLVCYCSSLCQQKGEGDHAAECQALAQVKHEHTAPGSPAPPAPDSPAPPALAPFTSCMLPCHSCSWLPCTTQAGTAAILLPDQLRLVIRIWLKVSRL